MTSPRLRGLADPLQPSVARVGKGKEVARGGKDNRKWKGRHDAILPIVPACCATNQTAAEAALWQAIRNRRLRGFKFRRQEKLGQFIVDFACFEARLVVEVDSAQHATEEGLGHDAERTAWLTARGFQLMRFSNTDVLKDLPSVLEAIAAKLKDPSTPFPVPPSPPKAGEGRGFADAG